jgi:hypothetical protein
MSVLMAPIRWLCITVDGWTSTATEAYTCVTAHFLTSNFNPYHFVLRADGVDCRSTKEALQGFFVAALSKFESVGKLLVSVSDNGPNYVAGLELLKRPVLRCFGHILHCCVTHAINVSVLRACLA